MRAVLRIRAPKNGPPQLRRRRQSIQPGRRGTAGRSNVAASEPARSNRSVKAAPRHERPQAFRHRLVRGVVGQTAFWSARTSHIVCYQRVGHGGKQTKYRRRQWTPMAVPPFSRWYYGGAAALCGRTPFPSLGHASPVVPGLVFSRQRWGRAVRSGREPANTVSLPPSVQIPGSRSELEVPKHRISAGHNGLEQCIRSSVHHRTVLRSWSVGRQVPTGLIN